MPPRSTTKVIKPAPRPEKDSLIIEHICLLKILRGKDAGTILELGEETVAAGRSEYCDLFIDDPSASRQHFEVGGQYGMHVLTDLDSTNGTMVNGVRVAECRLSNGDIVTVGATEIGFFEQKKVRAPRAKTPPRPPGGIH
ncbi:MAG: FHA domain-containing protein [Deltaproteobacteria bacterium]|nr:FHA domain-containing protein [Deltaproteobacteria bacterium]